MKFEELIGRTVPILIPMIHPKILQEVVIRGVEHGGIWIESENMTQTMLQGLNLPASQTPLFFVPFHEIKYALCGGGTTALSEKAFGV